MTSINPSIYIEYKNLSKESFHAEMQKDIISQIIKKVIKNKVIVEIDSTPDKEKNFILNCLNCFINNNNTYKINFSSLKILKKTEQVSQIEFSIKNKNDVNIIWKIELISNKKIYYIAAKKNISENVTLNKNDLKIISCQTADERCQPKNYFFSHIEAINQIENYENKKTRIFQRKDQEIDFKNLSKEIIIKSGQKLKVHYKPCKSLLLKTYGKALTNGGRGDVIRVQIKHWFEKGTALQSAEVIEGIAIAPGEVEYATK